MPTESKHTPEPWTYMYGAVYSGTDIDTAARLLVADRDTPRTAPCERDRNLERTVACVNACAGMVDPAADIAILRRIGELARAFQKDTDGGADASESLFALCNFLINTEPDED